MFLLRSSGSFALRLADRQFLPLSFQLPPRSTRLRPIQSGLGRVSA
jgi:hypothetical protein